MLPRQPNQSLIDGFRCLQYVVSKDTPVGISQIAEDLDMELTRVHRLLRTLTHIGLVIRTNSRKYKSGPGILVLAALSLHASSFADRVLPVMEALRRKTRLTVALGVLWERYVSYLYHSAGEKSGAQALGAHEVWNASESGLGMAALARLSDDEITKRYEHHPIPAYKNMGSLLRELSRIRREGFARIRTKTGEYTLAISLPNSPSLAVGFAGDADEISASKLLPVLQESAEKLDSVFAMFRTN